MTFDVAVIGAGPAGLMAAIRAAEKGAKVVVLEKMEKPARKLRITGKGRCNITNIKPEEEFLENIFPDARSFRPAFRHFSNSDLLKFLNSAGLQTVEERGGRVFPASQKAWDVADILVAETRKRAQIECLAKVIGFSLNNNLIDKLYYEQQEKNMELSATAYIIATGGMSYPLTGSTGDGYQWARQLGHAIVALRPSLTGLELGNYREIRNVSLKNIELSLRVDGGVVQREFGEMEFTEYGIDGPIVLKTSRKAIDAIIAGKKVELEIDFKPALSDEQIHRRIDREVASQPEARLRDMLKNLLPLSMIDPFVEKTAVAGKKCLKDLNHRDIAKLAENLKAMKFALTGYRPFTEAVVTAGGVDLKDVNPKTMRSKHVQNLYFAGEILNLDANTGGYNLQIAFSTGYLAGESAFN
jgi:predicted Rossmann fold flavoprotein